MTSIEAGLYLRVQQLQSGPKPLPLASGFSQGCAYRALGIYNPSETGDAYFALSNDRNEVWFISTRHFRTYALLPEARQFRFAIPARVPATGERIVTRDIESSEPAQAGATEAHAVTVARDWANARQMF